MIPRTLLLLTLFAFTLTGCIPPEKCTCDPCDCCLDGVCCPDGVCPDPMTTIDEIGASHLLQEMGSNRVQPNRQALMETKGGRPCLPCEQRPVHVSPHHQVAPAAPSNITPAKPPKSATTAATNKHAARGGHFACTRCKQPTVGRGWHTVYTESGATATFLCDRCWNRSTPTERGQYLASHVARLNYPADKRNDLARAVSAAH